VNKNLLDMLNKRRDWLNCNVQKIENLNKKLNYCFVWWYTFISHTHIEACKHQVEY